ncbi:hypothetical protein V2O64_12670 [Verrucomicrobiaceae bacterium 227]
MKKNPHPDRTSEAASIRDELSHQPEVLRSLDVLAREEATDVPIPPIPEDLREEWEDRFGAARQPVAEERPSWFARISQLWLYGGAAAVATIVIFISLKGDPAIVTPHIPGPPLRGGGEFVAKEDTMTVFIGSETIPFQAFADTRQADFILGATDLDSAVALLEQKQIDHAVILDATTGLLHPWTGDLLEPVQLQEVTDATDEYDLSEALDGFLKE